jgi:hypothetical protein
MNQKFVNDAHSVLGLVHRFVYFVPEAREESPAGIVERDRIEDDTDRLCVSM